MEKSGNGLGNGAMGSAVTASRLLLGAMSGPCGDMNLPGGSLDAVISSIENGDPATPPAEPLDWRTMLQTHGGRIGLPMPDSSTSPLVRLPDGDSRP
jgi:hypothetical protein